MNAWKNAGAPLLFPELDDNVGNIVPAVEDLLRRVTNQQPTARSEDSTVELVAPLAFPDRIGWGKVVADVFRYREAVRIDLKIDHNRMFAMAGGAPSDRRCFFNDYVASVSVPFGESELPATFVRGVVAGVAAARDAVRRHNRSSRGPWDEIRVAAREQ